MSEFPAEAIEYAFRKWRDNSEFFPSVADIRRLALQWKRLQAEEVEEKRRADERRATEEARESGELVPFANIVKELKAIATFPEPAAMTERQVRQKAAIDRLNRAQAPPALQLTQEQIEARRAEELAEIKRYEGEA